MDPAESEIRFKAVYADDGAALRALEWLPGELNRLSVNGNTFVCAASEKNALNSLQALLEMGADPNQPSSYISPVSGRNRGRLVPLMLVRSGKAVSLLMDFGADLTLTDDRGWSPLSYAANEGRLEVVERLVSLSAPVSQRVLDISDSAMRRWWDKEWDDGNSFVMAKRIALRSVNEFLHSLGET